MELVTIKDITTDMYLKRGSDNHKPIIVVIPGNPGAIAFYTIFIDQLYQLLEGQFSFVGVGHAGHGPKGANGGRVFNVQEQVDHKVAFLEYCKERFSSKEGSSPEFILMGHSIGSYMCLKAAKRKPELVSYVFNLFPTFKNLWRGLAPAVKVAILPGVRNTLSTIAHYAPQFITRNLLDLFATLTSEAKYILTNSADYYIIQNVLYMAYTEAQEILEKVDEEILLVFDSHQSRLVFIYGTTDPYTPLDYYKETKQNLPQARVELAEEGVPHAFVIHHSTAVATQCWLILRDLLLTQSSSS